MAAKKKADSDGTQRHVDLAVFSRAFLTFQIDSIDARAADMLSRGACPKDLLDTCRQCMEEIGTKFEAGEYYLPELVVAGEMFTRVSERLEPYIQKDGSTSAGEIVLGTPKGDIHHLGKDIFKVLAEASGFSVHDLGVDVAPHGFVQKIKETGASVLGMSALITAAFVPMQEVIQLLETSGLRGRVHVVIGGGVTTKDMAKRLKADAQTQDAYQGLQIVRSFFSKGKTRR
jgi:methanogenic corrinoid protein MtbC1